MSPSPIRLIEVHSQRVRDNLTQALMAGELFHLLEAPPTRPGVPAWVTRAARLLLGSRRWVVHVAAAVVAVAGALLVTGGSVGLVSAGGLAALCALVVLVEVAAAGIVHLGAPLQLRSAAARYLVAEATLATEIITASSDRSELDSAARWYLRSVVADCAALDRAGGPAVSDALVRRVATLMATAEVADRH